MACLEVENLFISIVIICTIAVLLIYLFIPANAKLLGRPIWHTPKKIIDYELEGKGTSQQVFDIYGFSHITHGVLLYFFLNYLGFEKKAIVYLTVLLEGSWELIENTPFITKYYRNYEGDSIVNNIGDIVFTVFGTYLSCMSPQAAILYVILSEMVLYPFGANFTQLSVGSLLS